MGASGSKKTPPKFEFISVNGGVRAVDVKSGKLKRIYYDHNGILRYQLVDRDHNGALEFSLVLEKYSALIASKKPLFSPGDAVYVLDTRWVGEWTAFAANGDLQPGPISNHKLVDKEGRFKENLHPGLHWRAVTKWHFLFFLKTYGISGPVIEFKAPRRAGDNSGGSRLPKSQKKEEKPTKNEEEVDEGGEENDGEGEEKKDEGGAKDKAALIANRQPPWMKLVRLEVHATQLDVFDLAGSITSFSTGLPYGYDLGVEPPESGISGMGGAAAGALMGMNVRASSAHVLCFQDAKDAARRKLGRLYADTAAVHAFLEAGARHRRALAAAARKADAKERRRAERKRKAAVARERAKQRKQEAEAAAVAAAAGAASGGGGEGTTPTQAVGADGLGSGVPSSKQEVIAEDVYGREFGFMMAAAMHRKNFRAARKGNNGVGAATFNLSALVFRFAGTQALFRRTKAAATAGGAGGGASAEGSLLHSSALGVVQAAWRVSLKRSEVRAARSAGHADLAPLAAALLQAEWRRASVQLGKRKAKAARLQVLRQAKIARLASALQKAFRNAMVRRKVAVARAEVAQQLMAFGAVKVQGKWRQFVRHRLERIAAGEEPPGGYGSDSESESDEDEEAEAKRKLTSAGAAAKRLPAKRGYAGMTAEEAAHRLDTIKADQRIMLDMKVQALEHTKNQSATDALAEATAALEAAEREAFAKRAEARPITVRVWAAKAIPSVSLAELQKSEVFFVVTALPSPPPLEALVGHSAGQVSEETRKKFSSPYARRSSEYERYARFAKNPELAQRAAVFSRPAKAVRAAMAPLSQKHHRHQTQDLSGCVDVDFKQEVDLSGEEFDGHSTLVFTLLRRAPKKQGASVFGSSAARDVMMGQATLKLHDLPDLWQHGAHETVGVAGGVRHNGKGGQSRFTAHGPVEKELPLGEYICRVWDGQAQKLKVESKEAEGGGKLKVSFMRQDCDAVLAAWVAAEVTPPKVAFNPRGAAGGGGGGDGKAAAAKQAKAAAAAAAKQALKPREFVRRWAVLSNGRLSLYEAPTAEPDLEVSLDAMRSCRVVQDGKLHPPDTPAHKAEEGAAELLVYFDAPKASSESLRRGRGHGGGAAAAGVAAGSHGFGTGPKNAKASGAVSLAAYGRGTVTLREDPDSEGGEVLTKLQRAVEKALFTFHHGN